VRFLLEKKAELRRVSFCTDILSPVDFLQRGSIDYCVRLCIGLGVPAITAIQMATLNSAECHLIDDDVGSLSPGRRADVILLKGALEDFEIGTVVAAGKVVAEDGRNVEPRVERSRPDFAYGTVRIGDVPASRFRVPAPEGAQGVLARVIGVGDGTIVTRALERRLPVRDGAVQPVPEQGINLIAAIDRHTGKGTMGLGFTEGFGLRRGAMAQTYNPHYQHVLVVGADPADMAVAAKECERLGGGFVVVDGGKVVARVPLPLYGLLSEESIDDLSAQISDAIGKLRGLGCMLETPFHTLAFTGLPVSIGTLKINSRGLIDVWKGETVPVILSAVEG
jgi:adenine deaminase